MNRDNLTLTMVVVIIPDAQHEYGFREELIEGYYDPDIQDGGIDQNDLVTPFMLTDFYGRDQHGVYPLITAETVRMLFGVDPLETEVLVDDPTRGKLYDLEIIQPGWLVPLHPPEVWPKLWQNRWTNYR